MQAKKEAPLRLQLNEKNVKLFVDLLTKIKMPFTLTITNYTTRIESENYNVYFMKNAQSNMTFAAAAKIKKDLKEHKPPTIDMDKNVYFDSSFKGEFFSDYAWNIDLKSAYATILFNDGYIKKETFEYLTKLPKAARLAAVGMCASRKTIFYHDANGRVKSFKEEINPLAPFFFYCVQKTEAIIKDLRNKLFGDTFLFSWVDSIYYLNENDTYYNIAIEYLREEYNIQATWKKLENFEVQAKKRNYRVMFDELKEDKKKRKIFNVPYPETLYKKKIINYLLKKQYSAEKN